MKTITMTAITPAERVVTVAEKFPCILDAREYALAAIEQGRFVEASLLTEAGKCVEIIEVGEVGVTHHRRSRVSDVWVSYNL